MDSTLGPLFKFLLFFETKTFREFITVTDKLTKRCFSNI